MYRYAFVGWTKIFDDTNKIIESRAIASISLDDKSNRVCFSALPELIKEFSLDKVKEKKLSLICEVDHAAIKIGEIDDVSHDLGTNLKLFKWWHNEAIEKYLLSN